MAAGLRQVASLPDPVGEVLDGWVRPNGLEIQRVRVPLGVVAIIYENRPNVTSDAAGLCLKSGNAALLRGSGSALRSNLAIAGALREGFAKAGLPEDALVLVDDPSHETAIEVMQLTDYVDCLIPRGGPALIQSIRDNATVPGDHRRRRQLPRLRRRRRPTSTSRSTSWSTRRRSGRACATRRSRSWCTRRSPTSSCPACRDALVADGRRAAWATTGRGRGCRRWARRPTRTSPPSSSSLVHERRDGAVARRGDRPREPVRQRPHRGDPHAGPRGGPPVHPRGRRGGGRGERVDAVHRRRRVRVRRRDRHLDAEAARARARWGCAS